MMDVFSYIQQIFRINVFNKYFKLCFTSLLMIILWSEYVSSSKNNVCVTKECITAAEELKTNINFEVDPCADFYEFACGGWKKNHPVPLTEQSWNPFSVATNHVTTILKHILESSNEGLSEETVPVKSAKDMYKACMNHERIESEGLKPLMDLLQLFGGWPILNQYWTHNHFNWQTLWVELKKRLYFHPIVYTDVGTDFKNSSQHILYIDQPSLVVLRQMLVSPEIYRPQLDAYKLFVQQIAELLLNYLKFTYDNSNNSRNINNHDYEAIQRIAVEVEEMVQFEIEIAKLMSTPEMRRDAERLYNKMSVNELQRWTDSASSGSGAPHGTIDWLYLLRMTFKDAGINIIGTEKVVVREMNYLFNLVKLLERTSLKTIANYLHWRFIEEYSNDLTMDMRKLHFQFRRIFTGAAEEQPRWKECVRSTQYMYGLALGSKYAQLYFDEKSKKSALEMVNNLHKTFYDQMDKVTWMDDTTKEAARDKIQFMTKFIGFPDYYLNNLTYLDVYYSGLTMGPDNFINMLKSKMYFNLKKINKLRIPVDRKEWPSSEPPVTVNAFYSPLMNAIIFPAAILQPPFFSKGRPDALNYGGIGVVIGHEITHGFDDLGRQYDKYGNLVQWWTENTIDKHFNKSRCFIEQYNNFDVPELNEILFRNVKLNGLLTLGENMADNGGLHQAYSAYKRSRSTDDKTDPEFVETYDEFMVNKNDKFLTDLEKKLYGYNSNLNLIADKDIRLPGLEMFDNEQLFFLGFASNWCESLTKETLLHEVLGNAHSPSKYRVLGSVANSPDFSKAFNCPIGSPMNPEYKCSFW